MFRTLKKSVPLPKKPFQERIKDFENIQQKYGTNICPIILLPHKSIEILKTKYLIAFDQQFGKFVSIIRKRITLNPEEALFFMSEDGELLSLSQPIHFIYNK